MLEQWTGDDSARYTTAERSEDVVYDSYFTRSSPYFTWSIPYSTRRSRVEYGMDHVKYGLDRVKYEKNQTRQHPRDKTHPRVTAPHIPRGVAEWNMRCCHEWMSFVEWMEPSLILFIYHVELSSASGISELYHEANCSNQE